MLGIRKVRMVTAMVRINYICGGEPRKITSNYDEGACLLKVLRTYLEPTVLTICRIPFNMKKRPVLEGKNERLPKLNHAIQRTHQESTLTFNLLDVAIHMELSLPYGSSRGENLFWSTGLVGVEC